MYNFCVYASFQKVSHGVTKKWRIDREFPDGRNNAQRIVQIILLSLLIINSAANYEDKLQSVFCTADKYGKVIACGGDHPQLS